MIVFKCAEQCYICLGEFTKTNDKVRDHCHRTGDYRGAAHTRCNINYFNNRYLPVVLHNLKGYDSHLSLKEAFEICGTDKNITAIPNSMEKFMTISIGDVKFIDSFQFMASSLETLAENLITKSKDKYEMFENMKKHFNADELELVCKQGFYPYEFMDNIDQFEYPTLPPKEKIFKFKIKWYKR